MKASELAWCLLFIAAILICADICWGETVPQKDIRQVSDILYGEGAADARGWNAMLNTYYAAKRPRETLLSSMERLSSAFRTKSFQYCKARSQAFTAYERRVYTEIAFQIENFTPAANWPYIHHEDFAFYGSRRAALAYLRRQWGPCIDYVHCVRIGREYYFKTLG